MTTNTTNTTSEEMTDITAEKFKQITSQDDFCISMDNVGKGIMPYERFCKVETPERIEFLKMCEERRKAKMNAPRVYIHTEQIIKEEEPIKKTVGRPRIHEKKTIKEPKTLEQIQIRGLNIKNINNKRKYHKHLFTDMFDAVGKTDEEIENVLKEIIELINSTKQLKKLKKTDTL